MDCLDPSMVHGVASAQVPAWPVHDSSELFSAAAMRHVMRLFAEHPRCALEVGMEVRGETSMARLCSPVGMALEEGRWGLAHALLLEGSHA